MRKKIMVLLSFVIMLTAMAPMTASASTFNNGTPWYKEANDIIRYGNTFRGTPYRFGAKYGRTDVFDCSSFTKWVYRNYRVLPRVSKDQAKVGYYVARKNLRRGDLVFFRIGSKRIGHVAIYTGNGKMLHTFGAGGVKYSSLNSKYWSSRYVTARRVLR